MRNQIILTYFPLWQISVTFLGPRHAPRPPIQNATNLGHECEPYVNDDFACTSLWSIHVFTNSVLVRGSFFIFYKVPKYEFGRGTDRHGRYRRKNTGKFDVSASRIQWKTSRTRIWQRIMEKCWKLILLTRATLGQILLQEPPSYNAKSIAVDIIRNTCRVYILTDLRPSSMATVIWTIDFLLVCPCHRQTMSN